MRSFLVLLLSVAYAISVGWYFPELLQTLPDNALLQARGGGWFHLVNFSWNGNIGWRLSPLAFELLSRAGRSYFLYFHLFFFTAGLLLYCSRNRGECSVRAGTGAAFFAGACIASLYGVDVFVMGSVVWLPFFWFALDRFRISSHLSSAVAVIVLSYLVAHSANQLSLIFFFLYFLVHPRFEKPSTLQISVLVIAGMLCFLPLIQQPVLDIPNYPFGGHVAASSGTKTGLWPLIGLSHSEAQIVEYDFLQPRLFQIMMFLFPFSIALLALAYSSSKGRREAIATAGVSLCLLLAAGVAGAEWAQIGPLATLSRSIPGLFSISLAPIFVVVAGMLSLACLIEVDGAAANGLLLCFIVALAWITIDCDNQGHPFFVRKGSDRVAQEAFSSPASSIVISPSYPLFRDNGLELLRLREAKYDYSQTTDLIKQVYTSSHQDLSKALFDGDMSTRWHPISGQRGKEWIRVELHSVQSVVAIRLPPGEFATDFPGALEVVASTDNCAEKECFESMQRVFLQDPWEGALEFTREGYPYYTHQGQVEIRFPNPVLASCIAVKQIAPYRYFDWSVAEFEVAVQ